MIRDISRNLRVRSILPPAQSADPDTGDEITYVGTHEIHVTADEIMLLNDKGDPFRATEVDVIVDITVSGVGGLDTGTRSSNEWYHIWLISDKKGQVDGLLSLSATKPELPFPKDFFIAYVGAIYNMNDCFVSYYQNDKLAWAQVSCPLAMTAFPTTSTGIDLSASVPSTAISVILEISGLTSTGGHGISNISVGPTPSGPWHGRWMMVSGAPQGSANIDHVQFITQSEIILDSAQQIYAKVGTPNDRLEIHVLGWRY